MSGSKCKGHSSRVAAILMTGIVRVNVMVASSFLLLASSRDAFDFSLIATSFNTSHYALPLLATNTH